MRNEKVALLGILACVKPKKSGIEEQEQKGVSTPNIAAKKFPTNCDFPLMNDQMSQTSGMASENKLQIKKE